MSVEASRLRLAVARLPGGIDRALRLFRQLTGLSAVTSLTPAIDERGEALDIPPAAHPRCAGLLRPRPDVSCEEAGRMHARLVRCGRRVHSHGCPLGLVCSCVPISLGDVLVGEARLVVGPETPDARPSVAARLLELTLSRLSLALYVQVLKEELEEVREELESVRAVRSDALQGAEPAPPRSAPGPAGLPAGGGGSVVRRALDYVSQRYPAPSLSLTEVAHALGCNEKYLAHRFSEVVGQHMRAYIVARRLHHACSLLLGTDLLVKQVGLDSGFHDPGQFTRSFHRRFGVSPCEYRRLFARPGA